jgi:hypothetical protein
MPSVAYTSISLVTTLTAVPLPDLTVRLPNFDRCLQVLASRLMLGLVNPFSKNHGAPSDEDRHVGDLGNFKTDGQGNAVGSVTDSQVKLIGTESVLGVWICPQH